MNDHTYFAGLFDGEGCITLGKRRNGIPASLRVSVANTYKPIITALKNKYGGNIAGRQQKAGLLTQWEWCVSGEDGTNFLYKVYPYLVIKKEQAEIAFKYQEAVRQGGRGVKVPEGLLQLRSLLKEQLTGLKKINFSEGAHAAEQISSDNLLSEFLDETDS